MTIRKLYRILLLLALSTFSATLWAIGADNKIKVMTYNQYIGADLKPILESLDRSDFNGELVAALKGMAANRFQDRVQKQAAIIAREKPDAIALQEVWNFQCKDVTATFAKRGCKDPSIAAAFVDFLDELLAALNAKGVNYRVVSRIKNLDFSAIDKSGFPEGIPFNINGEDAVLTGFDREVILVRNDLPARPVNFTRACPNRTSQNGCTYDLLFSTPTPIGVFRILHGFIAADVKIGKRFYRIANTHLEQREPSFFVQADQADELINTLQRTTPLSRTLLVLGDLNSSPNDDNFPGITPPYEQFLDAGYIDTWRLRRPLTSGNTCCQAESLTNGQSSLRDRIDFIFSRRTVKGAKVRLVGIRPADKTATAPKLWPSDHAGIVADLTY